MLTRNLASMDVEESIRGNPIDARRAAHRLRQDHAGAADGRGQLRRAGDRRHRRADAQRQARRQGHRLGHRRVAAARVGEGGRDQPAPSSCRPRRACRARPAPATRWAPRRRWPAWPRRWARRCRTTRRFRRSMRAATCSRTCRACASSRWRTKDLQAVEDPHARSLRERDPRQRRDRRLDQRGDPPEGDRRAHRRAISNSTTGRASAAARRRWSTCMPSGRFLMEEFYYAGGLPAVLRRLGEADLLPHPDALTVNGQSLWDNVKDAPIYNDEVIRPLDNPLVADGGIRVLRGNLAPRGAVLKPSAATPAAAASIAAAPSCSRTSSTTRSASSTRSARRRRRLRAGAEELRPEGLSGHGRGRQHGPAAEAAARRASRTWCASRTRA